jgi:hypothetical protein
MITDLAAAIATDLTTTYDDLTVRRAYVESLQAHELDDGEIEAIVTPAGIDAEPGSRAAEGLVYQVNVTIRAVLVADADASLVDAVIDLAEGMIPHFYRMKLSGAVCFGASLEQLYVQEDAQQAALFAARLRLSWR